MPDTPTAIPTVIRETGRAVIRLPEDTTFYDGHHDIYVAFQHDEGDISAPLLLGPAPIPILALWEFMGVICGDRAQRTVDRSLLVNGRPITPESYRKLWREAWDQPLTPQQFTETHGLILTFVLEGPLAGARSRKAPWTDSPFGTFADFEAKYRDEMEITGEDYRFRLTLDARRPDIARDAWYASSFLNEIARARSEEVSVTTELRAVTAHAADSTVTPSDLFSALEESRR